MAKDRVENNKAKENRTAQRSKAKQDHPKSVGPVSDLERHLPSDWWRTLFNALYLKTDGDVVENVENTQREIDLAIRIGSLQPNDRILDLCCGQGRHVLELARRGFRKVWGLDRSRYLIRQARVRAKKEELGVSFHEGDARRFRHFRFPFNCVMILGNSFGYFEKPSDDEAVLKNTLDILDRHGSLILDVTDGEWTSQNFERRSWEWIDQDHFVCRERELAKDGERIITREVITHTEKGVIADQFYAERLYSHDALCKLLEKAGFEEIRTHETIHSLSTRGQDLGMMAHRLLLSARSPGKHISKLSRKPSYTDITVLLGDPSLPDTVKLEGKFGPEDIETVERMKNALAELEGFNFTYRDDHHTLIRSLLEDTPDFVFNLCDEGFRNDAFMELHVPSILEMLRIPYTGSGPACLGLCYNKSLVATIAQSLDVPTPIETFISPGDSGATLPSTFPALVKPNFGDSSIGITERAVVGGGGDLVGYIKWLRSTYGDCPILVQEFLTGPEYSVAVIGNPGLSMRMLPPLVVDYSHLPEELPKILGYESKWIPESPYYKNVLYRKAETPESTTRKLFDYSNLLFERLGCRDYARFDFRCDGEGNVKLLEVNPNPGWCWDGKLNLMAEFEDLRYANLLEMILMAAQERLSSS